MAVLINGIKLEPQPAATSWAPAVTGSNLDGTETLGGYWQLTLSSPPVGRDQTTAFNWRDFENQVLTSVTVPAPGKGPEDPVTTYNSGVVSKKIQQFNQPRERTISGVALSLLVVV